MGDIQSFVAKIRADIRNFQRNVATAQKEAQALPDEIQTEVDANISKFRRALLVAQALAKKFEQDDIEKHVAFDTISFREFITDMDNMTDRFQHEMNRLARSIQSFGVVISNQIRGVIIMSLLSIIPVIGGAVGAFMALGNAIGTVAGGVLAFVGALGIAGLGVASYGGLIASVLARYNDEAFEATEASNRFTNALEAIKNTWRTIVDENMDAIFMTMGQAIHIANGALQAMRPFIDAVVASMRGMTNELKNFVANSPTMLTFFDNLNEKGVTVFENIVRGIGRFGQGIVDMFNAGMPLIEYIAQGFENLGTNFANWSARMREENGFQAFTEYVQENLPKIGEIFGNVFNGIIDLFAAFGDNSQTIFDRLIEMSEAFHTWSENIKASDGFQQFIDYIQTNGPTVMDLIGNIVMMVVNFAAAVAPLAQRVLEVTTNITGFIAELFRTNPIVAQIIAVLSILAGAFMAVVPTIVQITTVLIPMLLSFSKLIGLTAIVKTGLGLLSAAFAFLVGPVSTIIAVIAALTAGFVALYRSNETFRNLVQSAWSFISNFIVSTVATIVTTFNRFRSQGQSIFQSAMSTIGSLISTGFNNAMMFIAQFVANGLMRLQQFGVQIVSNIGVALAQFVSAISTWLTNGLSRIAIFISTAISNLVTFGAQMVTTIVSALGRFVAGIVAGTSNALSAFGAFIGTALSNISSFAAKMVVLIMSGMARFVSAISSGGVSAVSAIVAMGGRIVSSVASFVGQMVSAGANLVRGLVNGIRSMAGAAVSAAKGVVSGAIRAAKSLLGIRSPSRVFRDIGQYTSQGLAIGINKDAGKAIDEVSKMARGMSEAYAPELNGIGSNIDEKDLNGSITAIGDAEIRHDLENGLDVKQSANIRFSLGEKEYRGFVEDINDETVRVTNLEESYLGGVYE